jgi:hypothetical protein
MKQGIRDLTGHGRLAEFKFLNYPFTKLLNYQILRAVNGSSNAALIDPKTV